VTEHDFHEFRRPEGERENDGKRAESPPWTVWWRTPGEPWTFLSRHATHDEAQTAAVRFLLVLRPGRVELREQLGDDPPDADAEPTKAMTVRPDLFRAYDAPANGDCE
jgi:hypothetical protein